MMMHGLANVKFNTATCIMLPIKTVSAENVFVNLTTNGKLQLIRLNGLMLIYSRILKDDGFRVYIPPVFYALGWEFRWIKFRQGNCCLVYNLRKTVHKQLKI